MFNHERESTRITPANDALRIFDELATDDWVAEAARERWAPQTRITDSETPAAPGSNSSSNDAASVLLLSISPFGTATLAFVGQLYELDARG